MQTPSITLLHNMPRSGGTLVTKCFATMPKHIVLSEIHPKAQHAYSFNAVRQAQNWYGLGADLAPASTPFVSAIESIASQCESRDQRLLIRDWAHVDYFGPPVTDTASMKAALHPLLQDSFTLKHIRLLRHPLDTWMSFRRLNLVKKHRISMAVFMQAYRSYLEQIPSDYDLYYERFLQDSDNELRSACAATGLFYDPVYRNSWFNYEKVTGDKSNTGSLRTHSQIEPRERRPIAQSMLSEAKKDENAAWIVTQYFQGLW